MALTTGTPGTPPDATGATRPSRKRSWWRRPWMAPLALVTVAFIAFSLPPYLTGDPAQSRVPQPEGFSAHYPLLVIHVLAATIAMVACFLQVWPWFRRRHPVVHRRTGRIYVFAGVLPAGLTGLVIGPLTPFGPVLAVSNVMLALLWLGCTAAGYRMARKRRFIDHRRWMLRSFALTFSIITNRIWGAILFLTLSPSLDTLFQGNETTLMWTVAGLGGWLGWTVPLLIVEWWLEREAAAKRRTRARTAK